MNIAETLSKLINRPDIRVSAYEHDGTEYIVITGTGDAQDLKRAQGGYAYDADDVATWLETAEEFDYSEFCESLTANESLDLAIAVLRDLEVALNVNGWGVVAGLREVAQ